MMRSPVEPVTFAFPISPPHPEVLGQRPSLEGCSPPMAVVLLQHPSRLAALAPQDEVADFEFDPEGER
jgi:hypothetical protein